MDSDPSSKTPLKSRTFRPRHGSVKGNNSPIRRAPSPDSACEHDGEWVMGPVSEPDDMTSDLSEEGGDKSANIMIQKVSMKDVLPVRRKSSDAVLIKGAAGQDSDVDSGIVACRKLGERIGSTSSADTDSSQESRRRIEYSPPFQKNELSKSRSYTGSLRIPRHATCPTSGPVKGDHLALKECNRRPPTPLTVFPDSHHCVRFDEQLQLSEQNIRRSCRKLFATLYAQRFSYPSHQDSSSLHSRANSVSSRIRSRTVPELELRRYSPVAEDVQCRHGKIHKDSTDSVDLRRPGSSAWCHRTVHKSASDVSLGGKHPLPSQRYKSQYHKYYMDLPENEMSHTTSTDSGLGSLRNSSQCTCHSRQSNASSSQSTSVPTCTCQCCSCHQQLTTNVDSPPKLFKSNSCSTLSSTLSHQSRPQLTQFPPRTIRKVMSHSEDKSKTKHLQKTSSCSNLLDGPSSSAFQMANVPVYNDNMVHAYAHIASVIPEEMKSNCSSQGGRRAKTLGRLRYTTDNVFVDPPRPRSAFSTTSEPSRVVGRRGYPEDENVLSAVNNVDCLRPLVTASVIPQSTTLPPSDADTKSIISADIYSQITDENISSFERKPLRESLQSKTYANERPKSVGVVIPSRGPNPVYLKSALKKPTHSAIIQLKDPANFETLVKGVGTNLSEVEYAIVDKTKKNRFTSLPVLNGSSPISNTIENDEKDPPVPPKKNLHKSDFSLYRSRSSSPKKTLLERMQLLTKNAKSALQKAFSTERIYRPEREERMEGQKGLQRSRSFIRGLTGSFRKKKRKIRGPPTAEDVPQQNNVNPEWIEPPSESPIHVRGQLLQLNLDGSQVVELTKPPTKPYGFFVARGRVRNSKGVFVSRMRDQETQKELAGLLDIGDEILEIDGIHVKDADIMEVNRLMANKNTLLLTVLPYICRKDI